MRQMELVAERPLPANLDDCVSLYRHRLAEGRRRQPTLSAALLGYMTWPNADSRRRTWMSVYTARAATLDPAIEQSLGSPAIEFYKLLQGISEPALSGLTTEIVDAHKQLGYAADVLQMLVDFEYDDRVQIRGGPSIAKAVEVLELAETTPSHSVFRNAWRDFKDVGHLAASAGYLASQVEPTSAQPNARSIFNVLWLAPEAIVSLSSGYEHFGLTVRPHAQKEPFLSPERLWRVPQELALRAPILAFRRLLEDQIEFIELRRARDK